MGHRLVVNAAQSQQSLAAALLFAAEAFYYSLASKNYFKISYSLPKDFNHHLSFFMGQELNPIGIHNFLAIFQSDQFCEASWDPL